MISQNLINLDGEVLIYPNFFSLEESDQLLIDLINQINWQQDHIKMYGKLIPLPRLTAWYGEPNKHYSYSGIRMISQSWIPSLLYIKKRIEELSEIEFNSVLINRYRHGQDSMAWHSDDEPELGKNPIIASVSLGETRRFMLRHKQKKELQKVKLDLTHGSFLLMKGTTQHYWQHQIPKTKKVVKERINLTFRIIQK
jgi:alkylated DNA repair dioxygenase AlkB